MNQVQINNEAKAFLRRFQTNQAIPIAQQCLKDNDKYVSGATARSLYSKTSVRDSTFVESTMFSSRSLIEYAAFGRKAGTPPPFQPLDKWRRLRGLTGVTTKQLVFSIAKRGTNPLSRKPNLVPDINRKVQRRFLDKSIGFFTPIIKDDLINILRQ